jgi:hypothetical protein
MARDLGDRDVERVSTFLFSFSASVFYLLLWFSFLRYAWTQLTPFRVILLHAFFISYCLFWSSDRCELAVRERSSHSVESSLFVKRHRQITRSLGPLVDFVRGDFRILSLIIR